MYSALYLHLPQTSTIHVGKNRPASLSVWGLLPFDRVLKNQSASCENSPPFSSFSLKMSCKRTESGIDGIFLGAYSEQTHMTCRPNTTFRQRKNTQPTKNSEMAFYCLFVDHQRSLSYTALVWLLFAIFHVHLVIFCFVSLLIYSRCCTGVVILPTQTMHY